MSEKVELLLDLRSLRKEAGLPQSRVADLSGIVKSILDRIEKGDLPSLANALRMARFLQMPVEGIWGFKSDVKPEDSSDSRARRPRSKSVEGAQSGETDEAR